MWYKDKLTNPNLRRRKIKRKRRKIRKKRKSKER